MPLASIVLVNYNTPDDTIECIDSILGSSVIDISIVVIDNSQSNDSINKINSWVKGEYLPDYNTPHLIANNLSGKKPESIQLIHTDNIQNYIHENKNQANPYKLTIIKNSNNVGFAAANNIGIKYALQFSPLYLWLLNNDTIIKKDSLKQLINYYDEANNKKIKIGLIGSKIMFYSNPEIIQAVGDRFNYLTTRAYHIGLNQKDIGQYDDKKLQIDYPYGASIFLNSEYIRTVGLMNEDYFLYFEEIDWVTRGNKKGYKTSICTKSLVYHKQGISTGKKIKKNKPLFIACLIYSNLLKFYWTHYPFLYPLPWLKLFLKMNLNFIQGNHRESKLILKILLGFKNCMILNQRAQ